MEEALKKIKTSKIHLEIANGNWKKMDSFMDLYNAQPDRQTNKIQAADLVNEALLHYFAKVLKNESRVTE